MAIAHGSVSILHRLPANLHTKLYILITCLICLAEVLRGFKGLKRKRHQNNKIKNKQIIKFLSMKIKITPQRYF